MIKFFKKIRFSLFTGSSTDRATMPVGRYFKYAFGEIILVVIGILIAVSINNWNSNKQNVTKEQVHLKGLRKDLERQILFLKRQTNFTDSIIAGGENIIVDFSNTGNLKGIADINNKLSLMMFATSSTSINTTFNELNTTGEINLIQNDSLRSNIIGYYQHAAESFRRINSNTEQVFYKQVFPVITSSLIIHPQDFGYPLDKVDQKRVAAQLKGTMNKNLSNPTKVFELINAISLRILIAHNNNGNANGLLRHAKRLLADLDAELDKKGNRIATTN